MESGLSTGIWKKTPSEKEFRGGRMSFSSEVKEELSRHLPTARHCQIAETAAILSLCGQISEKDGTIRIQTENAYVARKYFTLLKKTFNIEAELAVKLNQKENTYLIRVNDREETRQILQAVKLHETDRQLAMPIPASVVQRQCCKRAFLRGAFYPVYRRNHRLFFSAGTAGADGKAPFTIPGSIASGTGQDVNAGCW